MLNKKNGLVTWDIANIQPILSPGTWSQSRTSYIRR